MGGSIDSCLWLEQEAGVHNYTCSWLFACTIKAWFTICRKGLATHALTLAATQPIAGIDSNSIPAFRRVAFKRQIEKFCVDSINSSLAKFNATPLRHIVNQA